MAKLTKRGLGLTDGYQSDHKKHDLIQKLGEIEHRAENLITDVCDHACRFPGEADNFELDSICAACPVTRLHELIE